MVATATKLLPISDRAIQWQRYATGPDSLRAVMADMETEVALGEATRLRPMPTGFNPLDDILGGGLRPGELLMLGGAAGVGKTIWSLQVARNIVKADKGNSALYICYEHDRSHLLSRLLCLESAELSPRGDALNLRKLAEMALPVTGNTQNAGNAGVISQLSRSARHAPVVDALASYADRLILAKASGDHSNLGLVTAWVEGVLEGGANRLVVVVDYLQKIPVDRSALTPETEVTTYLTQGLKELAMSHGVAVIAIAASDRMGLKAKRMRLSDLRGSSALQYEADIGLILNNKHAIVSREHMIYNPTAAEAMRGWVVMSVEKNRSGRNAVDMEYQLDAAHFRMLQDGGFVRERLVDEKVVLA